MNTPVTNAPAIMLPLGSQDYEKGRRISDLKTYAPILSRLGYCIGVEFKGNRLDEWATEAAREVLALGGRLTWHPSWNVTFGLCKTGVLNEELEIIAENAREFGKRFPLELVILHADVLQMPEDFADIANDWYKSQFDAEEVYQKITSQIVPLRLFNDRSGKRLSLENVPIVASWGERTPEVLIALCLWTGAWLDLEYIAYLTSSSTTVDTGHYMETRNFLFRKRDQQGLIRQYSSKSDSEMKQLEAITGYWVRKGLPPKGHSNFAFREYIYHVNPRLFHIEGGLQSTSNGRMATHAPIDYTNRILRQMMRTVFGCLIDGNTLIGAVLEVCGQGGAGINIWTEDRPFDDDLAKSLSLDEATRFIYDNPDLRPQYR